MKKLIYVFLIFISFGCTRHYPNTRPKYRVFQFEVKKKKQKKFKAKKNKIIYFEKVSKPNSPFW